MPPTLGWQANRHSRFEVAAPRHFLLPAILLLLAEEPRHGYSLAKGVHALQVGRVDRPSVYRALAQLEGDGLIDTGPSPSARTNRWSEPPRLSPDRAGRAGAATLDGGDQTGARRARSSASSLRRHRHGRCRARRGRRWVARRHRDTLVSGLVNIESGPRTELVDLARTGDIVGP